MKITNRVLIVSALMAAALLFAGCEPKAPPAATGSVSSADQVAIKYQTAGNGATALVFVHCWTCNRGYWDQQADYFAGRYQVVRLDLAGHGESGHERKDYRIDAFGGDVVAVVEKLGLKQVILIGHSMGGPVSVEAAKRLGDRVIGVVGVDTFYTAFQLPKNPEKVKQMVNGFLKPFEENYPEASAQFMRSFFAPGADPVLVERIADNASTADKAMALSAMRHVFGWVQANTPAALDALGAKLRNINANPKGDGKPLHAGVTLVAGAGHFIPQEKPAEFNQALEAIVVDLTGADKQKK
jgi:pimeloyl-ACP methyl ester carboxylesterase